RLLPQRGGARDLRTTPRPRLDRRDHRPRRRRLLLRLERHPPRSPPPRCARARCVLRRVRHRHEQRLGRRSAPGRARALRGTARRALRGAVCRGAEVAAADEASAPELDREPLRRRCLAPDRRSACSGRRRRRIGVRASVGQGATPESGMTSQPEVSVLVATRDRAEPPAPTLDSLAAQRLERDAWELVVVDNGSRDATAEVLAAHTDSLPLRILGEPRPGKSRALNAAIPHARGDLLAFTDDDVEVGPGWLAALLAASRRFPDASIFGGPIEPVFPEATPDWIRSPAFVLA